MYMGLHNDMVDYFFTTLALTESRATHAMAYIVIETLKSN